MKKLTLYALLICTSLFTGCHKLYQKRIKPFDIHVYNPDTGESLEGIEILIYEFNQPATALETIGDPYFIGVTDANGIIHVDKKLKTKEMGFLVETREKDYAFVGESQYKRILNQKKTEGVYELKMVPTGNLKLQVSHVCQGNENDAILTSTYIDYNQVDFADYKVNQCGTQEYQFEGLPSGDHDLYVRYQRDGSDYLQIIHYSIQEGETTTQLVNY